MNTIKELKQKGRSLQLRVAKLVEDADGVWRTVRGRRIFIGKGESFDDALKKSFKGPEYPSPSARDLQGSRFRGQKGTTYFKHIPIDQEFEANQWGSDSSKSSRWIKRDNTTATEKQFFVRNGGHGKGWAGRTQFSRRDVIKPVVKRK